MTEKTLFTIGRVTGVHGLSGNLKVQSYAESIDIFDPGSRVLLRSSGSRGYWYEIVKASPYRKGVLLSLKGVEDIAAAEYLKGKDIFISRQNLPEPGEDTFFWQDLIGLEVVDRNRGHLGSIAHIFSTGANDVFVVKQAGSREETLVPAVKSVVRRVSVADKTVETEIPEGL